jgi:hypothetical protein
MISTEKMDLILASSIVKLERAALALAGAPHWRVEGFFSFIRNGLRSGLKESFAEIDDETIEYYVDSVVERIEQHVEGLLKTIGPGGNA